MLRRIALQKHCMQSRTGLEFLSRKLSGVRGVSRNYLLAGFWCLTRFGTIALASIVCTTSPR